MHMIVVLYSDMGLIVWRTRSGSSSPGLYGICTNNTLYTRLHVVQSFPEFLDITVMYTIHCMDKIIDFNHYFY